MKWTILSAVFRAIVSLILSILLARILEDKDYSSYYSLAALMGILSMFVDFGLTSAVTYEKNLNTVGVQRAIANKMILSVLIFIALGFIISFYFYVSSDLAHATLAIIVCSSAGVSIISLIYRGMLERTNAYRTIAEGDFITVLLTGVIILVGYFIWKPASQYAVVAILVMGPMLVGIVWLSFNVAKNYPGFKLLQKFERHNLKLLSDSKYSLNAATFASIQQSDYLIVSKILPVSDAADYILAKNIALQVTNLIYSAVSRYVNAELVKKSLSPGLNYEKYKLKINKLVLLGGLAIAAGFIIFSDLYISILYGEKWSGAIGVLVFVGISQGIRFTSLGIVAQKTIEYGIENILPRNVFILVLQCVLISCASYYGGIDATIMVLVLLSLIHCLVVYKIKG